MKKKSRIIATSIATVAMCASLIAGGTYALFTSESTVNVAVTSGTVNVQATAKNLDVSDLYMGEASLAGGYVEINKMLPGDSVTFEVEVKNYSNVTVNYRTIVQTTEDTGLADALTVSFAKADKQEISFLGGYGVDNWAQITAAPADGEVVETLTVTIAFDSQGDEWDNQFNGDYGCKYQVLVEAVQGNASVVDPIKQDEEDPYTYHIYTEEGMRLGAAIANATPTTVNGDPEKWVKFILENDLNMDGYYYAPSTRARVSFDGQNHTIENLTASANARGNAGLMGYSSTASNVTLKNMTATGGQAGLIAGYAEGNTYSNIKIEGNNVVNYEDGHTTWGGIGAFIGINYATFENITVADNATITLKYNGMITKSPYMSDNFGGHFMNAVPDNAVTMGTNAKIETEGEWYQAVSDNAGLKAAIEAGQTTIYLADGDDYDLQGIQSNGLTLIGLGDEVYVANTTNFAGNGSIGAIWKAINLQNVTITNTVYTMDEGGKATFTNVIFAKGFREGYGSNVTFTDCKFGSNSEGYALHFQADNGSEGGKITLTGCEFLGGKVHLGGKRTYVFSGCDFAEGTDFQVWSGITLSGCTVNGVAVTAENVKALFPNLNLEKVTWQ